jgi:hypothetical protein
LNINVSDNDKVIIKTRKKSQGKNTTEARDNAEMIGYDFQLMEDELRLNGYFLTDIKNKFREQKVYVDIYIPENQVIYLNKSTRSFLYDVNNIQNIYDGDMAKHYYKMTENGLTCLDCEEFEFNTSNDSESFKMKIDKSGVHIEVQNEDDEKAEVSIDKTGIMVKSSKDSI